MSRTHASNDPVLAIVLVRIKLTRVGKPALTVLINEDTLAVPVGPLCSSGTNSWKASSARESILITCFKVGDWKIGSPGGGKRVSHP